MSEDTVLLEGSAGGIPAPGSEVGGYLLGEELGRGAQGAVYAASLAGDERLFAVKIVTLAGADAPMLVRLRREATLTARMAHPGIVTVHQVVETQRYLAIVMDRACGRPADRLCDGSLGWELALRIVVAAARALDYAHRRNGLIHRDLKPGNLIADIRGGVMHGMKVVDFGLGRDRSSAGAEVTMAGQVMGTPWYISPEQARGERDLTFATDIYSLGATLFHLVAGRPVFDAGSPIRTIMAHASEAPPTLASCVPACPVALSELVGYCLAKSPAQRFRSYRTFLAMAEPLLGGNPFEQVDADVPVTGATTRSAWRRPTTEVTADKPATTTRSLYRPPGHPGREVQPAPAPASTSEPRGTTRFMFPAVKLPASAPEAAVPSEPRRRDPATETTAIPASEIERTVGPAPDAIPAKSSLQPGERIDEHFTIVRALGSGAMGEVYEVEDQFIGRRLAMKIMSEADMMRPAAVARFKCEAAALASVGHVAFPYLAGGGTYRDRDYLYMELVQGVDLRTWLQRSGGVLPERTALSIALQLAQAMEAAYRVCGMVHRDLKPANIMIAESWDGSP
ncbi:MAG: protein kinase [Planctomycetes bacterium]|nr:protein kinase [Planctomycetota bacterium]